MLKDCSIGKVENHYLKVRMKEKPVYTGEQSQEKTDRVRGTGGLFLFFFLCFARNKCQWELSRYISLRKYKLDKMIKC